jgi:hypothetical protein
LYGGCPSAYINEYEEPAEGIPYVSGLVSILQQREVEVVACTVQAKEMDMICI